MSSQNPYQAPQADLENTNDYRSLEDLNLSGNRISVADSLGWIGEGWALFKAAPGIWIANLIIFLIIMMISGVIPFLGFIAQPIVSAVLVAGFMMGCAAIDDGESYSVSHLFAGLQRHTSQLVVVGLIQLVLTIVMVAVIGLFTVLFFGGSMLASGGIGALTGNSNSMMAAFFSSFGIGMILLMLLSMIVGFVIYSAILFAPVLVVLHDVAPMDAMKASFAGVWKNIVPFIVYGIVASIIMMISAIPLGLGLLVSLPVFIASIYAAYKQIYC